MSFFGGNCVCHGLENGDQDDMACRFHVILLPYINFMEKS